ncbi:hypothetical protein BSFA1_80470 (plasmid) [Burkholderia sp. SFA1]|nr:hypothetical protein BSFA1_80470 [Burkholderia sp. SFA1]
MGNGETQGKLLMTDAVSRLNSAAQAMLDAFGGNVPDWLRAEYSALETSLLEMRTLFQVSEQAASDAKFHVCEILGELIDYSTGRSGLQDFYPGKIETATGKLSLDRSDREVSLHVRDGRPYCCIRQNGNWSRHQVTGEGVAVLTRESVELVVADADGNGRKTVPAAC